MATKNNQKTDDENIPAPSMKEHARSTGDSKALFSGFTKALVEPKDDVVGSFDSNAKAFAKILLDEQVKSTLQQRFAAMVSRKYRVVPGGDDAIDIEAASHLEEQLRAISFDNICLKMCFGLFYGFAVAELMYGYEDGKVTLATIKVRNRARFRYDLKRRLFLKTKDFKKPKPMPLRKFWTFTAGGDHDDLPYGMGLAHWLYWPVWFKRNVTKFWAVYLEKFGMPTVVGKFSKGATTEDINKMLEVVANAHQDSGLVIPQEMALELLEAARRSGGDYDKFVDRMENNITKVVLTQTMTTENGSSHSQSETHADMLEAVARSDADILCDSFNEGPSKWLTRWNFPTAKPPRLERVFETEVDRNLEADIDIKMKSLGFEPTQERMETVYGGQWFKASDQSDDVLVEETSFADPSKDEDLDENKDLIDDFIDGISDAQWDDIMAGLFQPVDEMIASATSLEDVRDKLAGTITQMDDTKLAEHLQKAGFNARLAGLTGADEDGTT